MSLALILFGGAGVQAGVVYLALGDSVSFGYDPSTPSSLVPSFADQGFVRPFADSLASRNGGVRPTVLNLAIAGELSTTFFSAVSPPGWLNRAPQLNRNYPDGTTPQDLQMMRSIAAIHAAGNSVGYASFLIGGNDIFYLFGTPAFQNGTPDEQRAMIMSTLGQVQANYLRALGELRTLAPEAKLILPGYYDPFPSFAPAHALYESILATFNPAVAADAAAFGGTYVDLHAPFTGRELELTNIGIGDIHPNQAGYAVIAGALTTALVPEPSSILMLSAGLVGLAGYARARRAARPRIAARA